MLSTSSSAVYPFPFSRSAENVHLYAIVLWHISKYYITQKIASTAPHPTTSPNLFSIPWRLTLTSCMIFTRKPLRCGHPRPIQQHPPAAPSPPRPKWALQNHTTRSTLESASTTTAEQTLSRHFAIYALYNCCRASSLQQLPHQAIVFQSL